MSRPRVNPEVVEAFGTFDALVGEFIEHVEEVWRNYQKDPRETYLINLDILFDKMFTLCEQYNGVKGAEFAIIRHYSHAVKNNIINLQLTLSAIEEASNESLFGLSPDSLLQESLDGIKDNQRSYNRAIKGEAEHPVNLTYEDLVKYITSRIAHIKPPPILTKDPKLAKQAFVLKPQALENIISNLIINAKQFSSGRIEVSLKQSLVAEGELVITVTNYGTAMPIQMIRALKSGSTVTSGRKKDGVQGFGIGTQAVIASVKAMDGRWDVMSSSEGAAPFTSWQIVVPKKQAKAKQKLSVKKRRKPRSKASASTEAAAVVKGKPTIVYVDDNRTNHKLFQRMISRAGGQSACTEHLKTPELLTTHILSKEEAEHSLPDIFVLDNHISSEPEVMAVHIIKQIEAHCLRYHLPRPLIIVYSGATSTEELADEFTEIAHKVDGYLIKPLGLPTLRETLTSCMSKDTKDAMELWLKKAKADVHKLRLVDKSQPTFFKPESRQAESASSFKAEMLEELNLMNPSQQPARFLQLLQKWHELYTKSPIIISFVKAHTANLIEAAPALRETHLAEIQSLLGASAEPS